MEVESLISNGLQPQLYSFCELIISQQSEETVCHDNFKIEGGKLVQLEGERVCPVYVKAG